MHSCRGKRIIRAECSKSIGGRPERNCCESLLPRDFRFCERPGFSSDRGKVLSGKDYATQSSTGSIEADIDPWQLAIMMSLP